MTEEERDRLIRLFAAREVTWSDLRARGFGDWVDVLAALAERGLRVPLAPMAGPNLAARERGRALLRARLRGVP